MFATQSRLVEDHGNLLLTLLSPNGSSMCAKITLDLADRLANELANVARRMQLTRERQIGDEEQVAKYAR
jgi:hypothetical protein